MSQSTKPMTSETIIGRDTADMQPSRHRQLARMARRLRRWSEALFGGPENVRRTPTNHAVEYIQDSQSLQSYDVKKIGLVFYDPLRERVLSRLLKGIRGYRDMELARVHEGESMSAKKEVMLI